MATDDKISHLIDKEEKLATEELDRLELGWPDVPSLLIFAALFVTVFLQFFTRYVLNDSLSFTEELARYLLILLTFVAAIRCQLRDTHIRLEFLDSLARKYLRPLKIFSLFLSTIFFGTAGYSLWVLIGRTKNQSMVSLPFPKYYFYLLIVVTLICLIAVIVRQLVSVLKDDAR